jgi:hypothetical protein
MYQQSAQRYDNYFAVRSFPRRAVQPDRLARSARHVVIADRSFVPEFHVANYPIQGWIER